MIRISINVAIKFRAVNVGKRKGLNACNWASIPVDDVRELIPVILQRIVQL